MEFFTLNSNDLDVVKRLDYGYCKPKEILLKTKENCEVKQLSKWSKNNILTTSAFYPSITPYYQTLNADVDLLPFIRVGDTRKYLLKFNNTVFIKKDILDDLSGNIKKVVPGDIVITKGGEYIGEAALVPKYYNDYRICRDLLAIKTESLPFSGEYLCGFFISNHGKNELKRTKSVQGQPHLTLDKVGEIPIPYYGKDFEDEIIELWESFYSLINESSNHLNLSESRINSFLKDKLLGQHINEFFSCSLETKDIVARIDVEFYQRKWSTLVSTLKTSGIEFEKIKVKKQYLSEKDDFELFKYIALADIDERSGTIRRYSELKRHELPSRAKRKIGLNDLLVSSLKGSKEKIALVDMEDENLLASTGFFVVNSDFLNSEVIYALFRSKYYELFIEQMASGAIMSAITNKYFKQIELPIIDDNIQSEIQKDVMAYIEKRNSAFDNLDEIIKRFDEILNT